MIAFEPYVTRCRIAYFSMEMALRPEMHTYSGGLGVLAGDTARSCADLDLPVVFVTLASREGYLRQEIAPDGRQIEHADPWDLTEWAMPLDAVIADRLYGGGDDYRLTEEIVLGIGGARLLHALGFDIETYHMNEGHAALLAAALLRRYPHPAGRPRDGALRYDADPVRERCVFT